MLAWRLVAVLFFGIRFLLHSTLSSISMYATYWVSLSISLFVGLGFKVEWESIFQYKEGEIRSWLSLHGCTCSRNNKCWLCLCHPHHKPIIRRLIRDILWSTLFLPFVTFPWIAFSCSLLFVRCLQINSLLGG